MTDTMLTTPLYQGDAPVPRRVAPRGLVPSTWINRQLRVEYTDAWGKGQTTSGTLLDYAPVGVILNIGGGRTLLSWDSVKLLELTGN